MILFDIQAANYIAIIGIVKRSAIAGTDEPAMLGRRRLKLKTTNKIDLVIIPGVGTEMRSMCL